VAWAKVVSAKIYRIMLKMNIRYLVENERYVEALYFGALEIDRTPSAALHLDLGLACCGAIHPVSEL
jgi:hypothetical protein